MMNTCGKKIAFSALLLIFLAGTVGSVFAGGAGEAQDYPTKKLPILFRLIPVDSLM